MILDFATQDKISKHARTLRNQDVSARRRAEAEALSLAIVKDSSAGIYKIKWALFEFCMDPHSQDRNGVLDSYSAGQPNFDLVNKFSNFSTKRY